MEKTALMYAAARNSLDCLKALAPHESGRKAIKEDGSGLGYTALMVAANKGHINAIRLLLPYEQDLRDKRAEVRLSMPNQRLQRTSSHRITN